MLTKSRRLLPSPHISVTLLTDLVYVLLTVLVKKDGGRFVLRLFPHITFSRVSLNTSLIKFFVVDLQPSKR